MKKVNFAKLVAAGNDFLITEIKNQKSRISGLAKRMCDRKYGIGADGLLVCERSKVADVKMRIFNADGSEAEMCGNGARCFALWAGTAPRTKGAKLNIETRAGIIESETKNGCVKIKFTGPRDLKFGIPVKINGRTLKVNFINTGVPHAVIFAEGLDKINVPGIGRALRYHARFSPAGTNVDFVEVLSAISIRVRTYERGVEDETLACGTGAVASALITAASGIVPSAGNINVATRSGETLRVYFKKINGAFKDVWLEGSAKIICKGVYYV